MASAPELPEEIWLKIMAHLEYRPLCALSQCSRPLARLGALDRFWRPLWQSCFETFPRASAGPSSDAGVRALQSDSETRRSKKRRRLEGVVCTSEGIVESRAGSTDSWRSASGAAQPLAEVAGPADEAEARCGKGGRAAPAGEWRRRFRESSRVERQKRRLAHHRELLRADSHIQNTEAQLSSLRARIVEERANLVTLQQQERDLEQMQQAESGRAVWQPTAVRKYHEAVLEQRPVDVWSSLQTLKHKVKDTALHAKSMERQAAAAQAGLAQLRRDRQLLAARPPSMLISCRGADPHLAEGS